MKKLTIFIIGFVCGIGLTALVLVPELLSQRREKYEHGKNIGRIDGGLEVIQYLDKHFVNRMPMTHKPENVVDYFVGFKDRVIVVKTLDGVLTLETQ